MIRRYLQINDPHVSDQAPQMRTASYREDVLDKLDACMALAREHDVHGVVITGDLFHRKAANHTTHETVQHVRLALTPDDMNDVPVWIVPGNHDMARGSGTVAGQPLMSVADGYRVRLLMDDMINDPYIAGVPWNNAMEGPDGAAWIAEQIAAMRGSAGHPPPLVFAHAPLTPTPNPFGPEARGWLLTDDLTRELHARDAVPLLIAYGHMHNRNDGGGGVLAERDGRVILPLYSNPGALSRGTIADTEQAPMVALITYEDTPERRTTVTTTYLPVPHRPASEVFRLREHAARTDREEGIANLAAGLATAETYTVTPEALVAQLEALVVPEGVEAATWREGIGYAATAVEGASA